MTKNKIYLFVSVIVLAAVIIVAGGCVSAGSTQTANAQDDATPTPKPTPTSEPVVKDEPTAEPTIVVKSEPASTPTAKPTDPPKKKGSIWMSPNEISVAAGNSFKIEIHLHTGDKKIAAYGFNLMYDPKIVTVDIAKGSNGVEIGPQGFVSAVNANEAGTLVIAGFDAAGQNPGKDLSFLVVNFIAKGKGNTELKLTVRDITDLDGLKIAEPDPSGSLITVK